MYEILDLTDEFENDYLESIAILELREMKALLPLSLLGLKRSEKGNTYVYTLSYQAYPIYATIEEQTSKVRITRDMPNMTGFVPRAEATEDEVVFPHVDYQYIIYKAMLIIASEKYLWVPMLGSSKYCKNLVGLPSGTFEDFVREVIEESKEK